MPPNVATSPAKARLCVVVFHISLPNIYAIYKSGKTRPLHQCANSLLHHLHDPQVLWRTVREAARPGVLVLIMDLMRPPSAMWAESLVATDAADAPEVLCRDFRNSLFAAFEPQEVAAQLREPGLGTLEVRVVSDRHLIG